MAERRQATVYPLNKLQPELHSNSAHLRPRQQPQAQRGAAHFASDRGLAASSSLTAAQISPACLHSPVFSLGRVCVATDIAIIVLPYAFATPAERLRVKRIILDISTESEPLHRHPGFTHLMPYVCWSEERQPPTRRGEKENIGPFTDANSADLRTSSGSEGIRASIR